MTQDKAGNWYEEVDNIRITYVPAADRSREADWAGSDVIRMQAYKGSDNKSLHMGAELPVGSPMAFIRMVAGLCAVYERGSH